MTETNDQVLSQDVPNAADVPAAAEGQSDRRGSGRGGDRRGGVIGAAGGTGESRNETQSGKSVLSRFVESPKQSKVARK